MPENILCEIENINFIARFDFLDLCLLGETGTGKTHLARRIHELSPRSHEPFIALNCAELSPSIIEAELFGYEKGAFTGAMATKIGKFEAATGGTLFLDEIGELSVNLQAKLLKAVDEKIITRVGGIRARPVDVRLIFATHRDLSVLRDDLRYRIAAHVIRLKPLRERKDEILPLAKQFMEEFGKKSGYRFKVSENVLKLLEKPEWKGNLRELRFVIRHICLRALAAAENSPLSETVELSIADITAQLGETAPASAVANSPEAANFRHGDKLEEYIKKIETDLIRTTLQANNYNQTRTARDLGLSRGGLIKKLKRIGH